MTLAEAISLIAPAVRRSDRAWADLGAGDGTFTRALAGLLGAEGRIVAVDRDARAVAALTRIARTDPTAATVDARRADLGDVDVWMRGDPTRFDGILLANALHFVPADTQASVLVRLADRLGPGGRLLVVEYDDRPPSRWVPYPVAFERLGAILPSTVGALARIGTRRSAYGGAMYAAAAELGR